MGILNLTPDSFSDGGQFNAPELAEKRILALIDQGADIIDIGGESTGPGSNFISEEEEMNRLKEVIDFIEVKNLNHKCFFSLDTYKAGIAEYGLKKGFQMINDVTALRGDPKMIEVLSKYQPYVVLMYAKNTQAHAIQEEKEYKDVVQTIKSFLEKRVDILLKAGFSKEKIILDPGMGAYISAKPEYSFEIIERLKEFESLGYPLLVGISRKSCLGGEVKDRDKASVEWSVKAIENGASIIRIHNVGLMEKNLKITKN